MITLICGVCRAGKTTYSRLFNNVIHLDDVEKPGKRYAKVNEILDGKSGDVVVEGVYETAEYRSELLKHYKGEGKRLCIWLDPSEETIKSRLRHQPFYRKRHFEPPTYAEGWDEIIIGE